MDRREFLKRTLISSLTLLMAEKSHATGKETQRGNRANEINWAKYEAEKKTREAVQGESYAVLVDITKCIGCRRCEWACNEWNKNPNKPLSEFEKSASEKPSVFDRIRRTDAETFTIVNRFYKEDVTPIYVKKQCMHCLEPACLSACFVSSFEKTKEGSVLYNPSLCVGCRYCMIACPFDIPAYEYFEPLRPQITKCTMCFDRIIEGKPPACVEICSADALIFGKRSDIIKLAHRKLDENPERYIPHVYGEYETGGTSWLYLSPVPFEKLGFPKLSKKPDTEKTASFLFTVKVLEVVASVPLVYAAYKAISSKGDKEKDE